MAGKKLSQISAAGRNHNSTDFLVGVDSGNNDLLFPGGGGSGSTSIVTSGSVVVSSAEGLIVINKGVASATPVTLPTVASRNGLALVISDFAGTGGDITITPASGERIHGLAANAPWTVTSGGAGLGGRIRLLPVATIGWVLA